MSDLLSDRVIVVTGGAGLIGSEFVRAISDAGGVAVIAELDLAKGEQVRRAAQAAGPSRRIEVAQADITSADSLDALVVGVIERHGRIDGLVNNAYPRNANYGRPVEQVTYEDFTVNVGMHLGGYFLACQRFLTPLRQSRGVIVNIASIYGVIAPRFQIYRDTEMTMPVEYAAIKSGVIHLTRYFAQYSKRSGIRVNCLSPGGVLDGQAESFLEHYREFAGEKGMLAATDLTGTLLFLLSDASRFVNGQNVIVDDGWSL